MAVIQLGLIEVSAGAGLVLNGFSLSVAVANSVTIAGAGNGSVQLVNDTATPAASSYYGTNGAGVRGYYALAAGDVTSIAGTTNQIVASASVGAVTLSLATSLVLPGNSLTFQGGSSLTDSGTGALAIAAGGTNSSITLTPAGTGFNYIPNPFNLQIGTPSAFWRTGNWQLVTLNSGSNATVGPVNCVFFGSSQSLGVDIGYVGAASTSGQYGFISATVVGSSANTLLLQPTGANVLIGGGTTATDIAGAGGLKVFGATAATTTTSGAFQVVGGVGIQGAAFFGSTGSFAGQLTLTSSASGLTNMLQIGNPVGTGTLIPAIEFNVSTAAEAAGNKLGIGAVRNQANGRGALAFYLNTANTTAAFTTSDEVMRLDYNSGSIARLLLGTTTLPGGSGVTAVFNNPGQTASSIEMVSGTGGGLIFNGAQGGGGNIYSFTGATGSESSTSMLLFTTTASVTVQPTTVSSSVSTGSLINLGGFGNAGASFFGGAMTINSTVNTTAFTITDATTSFIVKTISPSSGGVSLNVTGNARLFLQTAGTTALTLDASQNATFAGTVTTTGTLTVNAGSGNPIATFNNSAADASVVNNAYIQFQTASTNRWYIGQSISATNGNFEIYDATLSGIGLSIAKATGIVTTPQGLAVTAATASTTTSTGALVVTGGVGIGGSLFGVAATFSGLTRITSASNSILSFFQPGVAEWTIGQRTAQTFVINSGGNFAGTDVLSLTTGGAATFAASVSITSNLTVAGTITNASDLRLKTDIVDSDLGLSFILGLRPVAYTLRAAPASGRHYGLIAQELASSFGNIKVAAVSVDSTGHYGVAYSQLIAPMIKSTQELYAEIVALKARVLELEAT